MPGIRIAPEAMFTFERPLRGSRRPSRHRLRRSGGFEARSKNKTVNGAVNGAALQADPKRDVLEKLGGRTRARTWDPMIKSHLLYQLSYAPGLGPEKAFARGRRLAKRFPDVQQTGGSFPDLWRNPGKAKSRRIPAASAHVWDRPGKPVLRAAQDPLGPARDRGRSGCGHSRGRGPGRHRHRRDSGRNRGAASPRHGRRTGGPFR